MKIQNQVNVLSITQFERINTHLHNPRPEAFVAITMQADDGQAFVTFTRASAKFAEMVSVGDRFRLGGKFKREQTHNGIYAIVVTNATVNRVEPIRKVNKRTLRVQAALLA
jgi:hypothetical protein